MILLIVYLVGCVVWSCVFFRSFVVEEFDKDVRLGRSPSISPMALLWCLTAAMGLSMAWPAFSVVLLAMRFKPNEETIAKVVAKLLLIRRD